MLFMTFSYNNNNNNNNNRFALKNLPKWGFCGILGRGVKIFGGNPLGMQWPPIYVVWWKNYGGAPNSLVCTVGKEITKKRNVYAVRVTFHPCAALTPLNVSVGLAVTLFMIRSTWYGVRGPHHFSGAHVSQQPLPSLVLKLLLQLTIVQTVRTACPTVQAVINRTSCCIS